MAEFGSDLALILVRKSQIISLLIFLTSTFSCFSYPTILSYSFDFWGETNYLKKTKQTQSSKQNKKTPTPTKRKQNKKQIDLLLIMSEPNAILVQLAAQNIVCTIYPWPLIYYWVSVPELHSSRSTGGYECFFITEKCTINSVCPTPDVSNVVDFIGHSFWNFLHYDYSVRWPKSRQLPIVMCFMASRTHFSLHYLLAPSHDGFPTPWKLHKAQSTQLPATL